MIESFFYSATPLTEATQQGFLKFTITQLQC